MKQRPLGQIARLLVGFAPEWLAEKLDLKKPTAYRWRNGSGLPPANRLPDISRETGIPARTLRDAYAADIAARREAS